MLRDHRFTLSASAKFNGSCRATHIALLSRETAAVVAIRPLSARANTTSAQNALTVSMPTTSLGALALTE